MVFLLGHFGIGPGRQRYPETGLKISAFADKVNGKEG